MTSEEKKSILRAAPTPPPGFSPQAEAAQAIATGEGHKPPPQDPRFVIEAIGSIPFTAHGQHYSKCKVMRFEDGDRSATDRTFVSAQDLLNEWFAAHQNILVVQMDVSQDGACITVVVTNTLTDEQLEIVNMRAHIIEKMVQEEMEKKAAALAEAEANVENEEKRLRELAAVGEKCINNHGAVVKQLRAKGKK